MAENHATQLNLFSKGMQMPAHCQSKIARAEPIAGSTIARPTDKATSHEAAAEIKPRLSKCQQVFVDVLGEINKTTGPATATEVAQLARLRDPTGNAETYRKRAAECVNKKLIYEIGRRKCHVTGKPATTYAVRK